MSKEIRFSQLVAKAGKPETATLWTKPKDNPALLKAINENRIVTVVQKPTGIKRDFGLIGFHQEKFATYLVFPKRLPHIGEARVIGIKYDLLQEPTAKPPPRMINKPAPARRHSFEHDGHHGRNGAEKEKPKPELIKRYRVTITRTGILETTMEVDATSISKAEEKALQTIKEIDFLPNEIKDLVKSVVQI